MRWGLENQLFRNPTYLCNVDGLERQLAQPLPTIHVRLASTSHTGAFVSCSVLVIFASSWSLYCPSSKRNKSLIAHPCLMPSVRAQSVRVVARDKKSTSNYKNKKQSRDSLIVLGRLRHPTISQICHLLFPRHPSRSGHVRHRIARVRARERRFRTRRVLRLRAAACQRIAQRLSKESHRKERHRSSQFRGRLLR